MRSEALRKGIRWIDDPTEVTPTCQLRPGDSTLDGVAPDATLFVPLPVSTELAAAIGSLEGVEIVEAERNADYVLVGRLRADDVEYAWIRPGVTAEDSKNSALPARSAWIVASRRDTALTLRETLTRLQRVHGWHDLESPPGPAPRYELAVRRRRGGALVGDRTLIGRERYRLSLRQRDDISTPVLPRYFYVFVIDSNGNGVLLFPARNRGAVENRLPAVTRGSDPVRDPPQEIPLGIDDPILITEPFGVDTYFLLSTGEPLGCLSCLEWEGVRGPTGPPPRGALARLLVGTAMGTRGNPDEIRTPPTWSLQRVVFKSVPPGGEPR
jgi:hypothetical protein